MEERVLGRYDAAAIRDLFAAVGVLEVLEQKGFGDLTVTLQSVGRPLPHITLSGCKGSACYILLDACVGEAVIRPDWFERRGCTMERAIDLAVVHWVREQDPTAPFPSDRPRLPLQRHPGLGVLRRAFRVVVQMASELGKDGVANVPKFFHDAVIFFRSRLFLFLDGEEQGRFEALVRDLRALPLGDASLALAGECVRDASGGLARWCSGYQVFPISPPLSAYFHSDTYAAQVAAEIGRSRFVCDRAAVARTRSTVAAASEV